MRSFDERGHSYLGYSLVLEGVIGGEEREFSVGIGKAAQDKHAFRVSDEVSGRGIAVADSRKEPVEFYRASKLRVLQRVEEDWVPPPWHGAPPDLQTYRWRGHRRLSARTYGSKCRSCIWGCRMSACTHWAPSIPSRRLYRCLLSPADQGNGSPLPLLWACLRARSSA